MSDQPAAGPWMEGAPSEEGRYLVQYCYDDEATRRFFIGDWTEGDPSQGGHWIGLPQSCRVVLYAHIHPPHQD